MRNPSYVTRGVKFARSDSITVHVRIHSGEKPLDARKQLFVLNSYKSAIKKPEVKKVINKKKIWSDLNHDLNQ